MTQEAYKETQSLHLPHLLLSFIGSLTSHIDRFSDSELLACLQLVVKIFSHIQSPVTHVASPGTSDTVAVKSSSKSPDGRAGDQPETKPTDEAADGDIDVDDDRYTVHSPLVFCCKFTHNSTGSTFSPVNLLVPPPN